MEPSSSTSPSDRARPRPTARRRSRAALARRRARVVLVVAVVFAAVVVVTSFPVSALLTQRTQLSSTQARDDQLRSEDLALSHEVANLNNPTAVADVARSDYGFVPPGDKAYEVLPEPGSSPSSAELSGHVPLDGPPVVPGSPTSQQLLGAGSVPVTSATATGSSGGSGSGAPSSATHSGSDAAASAPFLSRVLDTLEFWR